MADFGDQEYQEMLCVETTNAADDAIAVPPGETHKLALTLSLA
jgi:glucose-6-phosphate 1-epimerase